MRTSLVKRMKAKKLEIECEYEHRFDDVDFYEEEIRNLRRIRETVKSAIKTKKLTLSFENVDELKDQQLRSLSRRIGVLTSLRTISLRFLNCHEFGQTGMLSIGQMLKKLTLLEVISLEFSW